MIFTAKSPTRVDLAGGTLDLWPLYNFVGGAPTTNVAIDIFTYAKLEISLDGIEWVSEDLKQTFRFKNLDHCLEPLLDPKARLFQEVVRYFKPETGFRLTTKSESPVGGGLGGSSSLLISILKVFSQWLGPSRISSHEMVRLAHNIEAAVLNTPTGTQDYYPALCGGLQFLDYEMDGVKQKVVSVGTTPLVANFILVYTGQPHHSGLNNFEVVKAAVIKDEKTMAALNDLKSTAEKMRKAVKKQQWQSLPQLMREETSARIRLSKGFSSEKIEQLQEVALQAGADAIKICGAGGGGCVWVWADPAVQGKVRDACQKAGFQVLAAKPVEPLSQ